MSLQFTHISIKHWRNFKRVDVPLAQRVFLVGPNASGKSNLLDVFRFLRDLVAVGGGFEYALAQRGGVSALRCLAATRNPNIAIKVTLGDNATFKCWTYEIVFGDKVISERVTLDGKEILKRPKEQDKKDPDLLTQTYLEQKQTNREFREIADFFAEVNYMHLVPQLIRFPDRYTYQKNDPFGSDFMIQISNRPEKERRKMLARISEALKKVVPQLRGLEFSTDEGGKPHIRGKYVHWRKRGAWQYEDQFSDGTLRLIGVLWALQERKGPLLLEEPELSLHPQVVRHIPQMLARVQQDTGRQVIISTHSSDLLQDSGIGLDEVLLLIPKSEGTEVSPASSIKQIKSLLEKGMTMADVIIPMTGPREAHQLALPLED